MTLTEIKETRRQWNDVFKVLKENRNKLVYNSPSGNTGLQKLRKNTEVQDKQLNNFCCKQKYLRESFKLKGNDKTLAKGDIADIIFMGRQE